MPIYLCFVCSFFDNVSEIQEKCHNIDQYIKYWHKEIKTAMKCIDRNCRTTKMIHIDLKRISSIEREPIDKRENVLTLDILGVLPVIY